MTDSPRRMDRKAFLEWRQSPLTKLFSQYLRDTAEGLAREWASGTPMSQAQQDKAQLFLELADLEWVDVAAFYGIPVVEDVA